MDAANRNARHTDMPKTEFGGAAASVFDHMASLVHVANTCPEIRESLTGCAGLCRFYEHIRTAHFGGRARNSNTRTPDPTEQTSARSLEPTSNRRNMLGCEPPEPGSWFLPYLSGESEEEKGGEGGATDDNPETTASDSSGRPRVHRYPLSAIVGVRQGRGESVTDRISEIEGRSQVTGDAAELTTSTDPPVGGRVGGERKGQRSEFLTRRDGHGNLSVLARFRPPSVTQREAERRKRNTAAILFAGVSVAVYVAVTLINGEDDE